MAAAAMALLSACGGTGDITAKMAPALRGGSEPGFRGPEAAMAAPLVQDPGNLAVTPRQRAYLDALTAAGVRRTTDLRALSIGSYVCQGRAAGQNDQAVWDFVFPLVRAEVDDLADAPAAHANAPRPPVPSATDAAARYIRLATEQLC